jgi:catechol 2,3-dioxygenase
MAKQIHTREISGPVGSERSYGIAPPAFRLPDATHIGGVRVQVSDLVRSVAYYEQVIGLRVISAGGITTLGPHGDDRPLVTLQTSPGITQARRGTFGLYHFAILLPDRAALGRFVGHLSENGARVGAADHLVSESLYLWDPDGLGIEVYADRPRNSWRRNGRELAMTTEALDIPNVIAAGRGIAWDGMPPGTTMGHVHLSVGSLEVAETFYHRALGFDKTVWSYPGALFLAAGGYHHHLGTNIWSTGPSPSPDQAQLLEWELIVPSEDDVIAAARSLESAGYASERSGSGVTAGDPWGTRVHICTKTDVGL